MPYHKGELDYLAPSEDSEAMLELKEMQKTLSWQKYPTSFSPFSSPLSSPYLPSPFIPFLLLFDSPYLAKYDERSRRHTHASHPASHRGQKRCGEAFSLLTALSNKTRRRGGEEREGEAGKDQWNPGKEELQIAWREIQTRAHSPAHTQDAA